MIYQYKALKTNAQLDINLTFDKDEKIFCMIGKNGVGKTLLLENMIKSIIFNHSIFGANEEMQYKDYFNIQEIKTLLLTSKLLLPKTIEINNNLIKDDKDSSSAWGEEKFYNIHRARISNHEIFDKPFLYIGAPGRGYVKNVNSNNLKILETNHVRLARSILSTMSYLEGNNQINDSVSSWFFSRLVVNPAFISVHASYKEDINTVLNLLGHLDEKYKVILDKDNHISVPIHFDDGKIFFGNTPIDKLPSGYVSLIKIFQSIVDCYSSFGVKNFKEAEGVIFIDEIEAHLHVQWQIKIIPLLKEFFPKTSFYITTHSPIILSGLKTGEAYELYQENDTLKNKKIRNIESYVLNDLIFDIFNVDINDSKLNNNDKKANEIKRASLIKFLAEIDAEEVL